MRQVTAPGRLIWGVSGIVTVTALAVPGAWLIAHAGTPAPSPSTAVPASTVTIAQPVTSVNVQSYGAPIRVLTGSGNAVTVSEMVSFNGGGPPAVTAAVSGGRLTLDAPACGASLNCSVGFTVTIPTRVTVTAVSSGGPVTVDGAAGANIDSGGGAVRAAGIDGPLTVSTEGGPLSLAGLTGSLYADTGGGSVVAQGVTAATATVITSGGNVWLPFAAAPDSVQVDTGGGAADLIVPGGPYAVTIAAGGGPESVGITGDPAAARTITVSTGGGPLQIEPARETPRIRSE